MGTNDEKGEAIVRAMLRHIGEDVDREGLHDTPKRIVKMWKEVFRGYDKSQKPVITTFRNGSDGIVIDEKITDTGTFHSHCEHHGVPFYGKYYFAYIPHPDGLVLGLSKIGRIVHWNAARFQIQERLVHEVVDDIWKALSQEGNAPLAVGLVLEGEHLCKTMRGIKDQGKMTTTKLVGSFKSDPAARAEFISFISGAK